MNDKIEVTETNFTQFVADADDFVNVVEGQLSNDISTEVINIGAGVDHIKKLLAVIDFLIS